MPARIQALRELRGWSQQELADRAGVSRQLVGAVEGERHAPNVRAAIGLARALGTSVEALFDTDRATSVPAMGDALRPGTPVVTARVGTTLVAVPVSLGVESQERWGVADATVGVVGVDLLDDALSEGLVVAGCDPIVGIVAGIVERTSPHRIVTVHGSTRRSIDALASGRVHAAVVHSRTGSPLDAPIAVRRFQVARWLVGLAGRRREMPPSLEALAERRQRVVQRDAGAESQAALERALASIGAAVSLPGPVGEGHIDVARRVSHGGSSAGVTMEAAAVANGLGFTPLEEHTVELWLDERWAALPAASAIVDALSSGSFRQRARLLGGYDVADAGTERRAS